MSENDDIEFLIFDIGESAMVIFDIEIQYRSSHSSILVTYDIEAHDKTGVAQLISSINQPDF